MTVRAGAGFGFGELFGGTAGEEEMGKGGFEQVVADFVFVVDGADDVGADVAFAAGAEAFEAAPDAAPVADLEGGFCVVCWVVVVVVIGGEGRGRGRRRGVDVDPVLDFDGAGAVVELVGHVGG